MQLNFVIPGHYRHNDSPEIGESTDSKIDIIRVLGEDPKKPDYFILQDGRSLSESNILDNYVFFQTASSEKDKLNTIPNNLLVGIGDEEPEIEPVVIEKRKPFSSNIENEYLSNIQKQPEVKKEISLHTPEEEFTIQILKKLKQNNSSTLQVTVNLEIPYDLNKLRESIELLNLDKEMVSSYILHGLNLFDVLENSVRNSLLVKINESEKLPDTNFKTIESNIIEEQIHKLEKEIPEQKIIEINDEIAEGFQEIENRFSKIIKNNIL